MAATTIRHAPVIKRNGETGSAGAYRAMSCAVIKTPNAISGTTTTCARRKKRCKTNNAEGAVARLRLVIQTNKGPAKTNAIMANQKYQDARRQAASAPNNANVPATGPNETTRATILAIGEPPI